MAFDNPYNGIDEEEFKGGVGSNPFNYAGPDQTGPVASGIQGQTVYEEPKMGAFSGNTTYGQMEDDSDRFNAIGHYSKSMNGIITERSVILCLIFCVLSFGIYGIYWKYKLNNEINFLSGEPQALSGGWVIFWDIVTMGFFSFYWHYIMGERVDRMRWRANAGSAPLFLILRLCHLGILNMAMMQNHINTVVRPGF